MDLLAPTPLLAGRSSPIVALESLAPPAPAPPPRRCRASEEPPEEPPLATVEAWAEKNQNLRALLSTLHEVTPRAWGWEPKALAALIDTKAAHEAYRRAACVVHPDKLIGDGRPQEEQERGQAIFRALRRAQGEFKRGAQ